MSLPAGISVEGPPRKGRSLHQHPLWCGACNAPDRGDRRGETRKPVPQRTREIRYPCPTRTFGEAQATATKAPSREREKGAARVMGGPGERSPRSGFEGAGAPRQPQCITLGRLAPRHYAVRRRPRCPASHGVAARRARRGQVEGRLAQTELRPRPSAVDCRGRQFRFPHRRRDLRSLRGKSVQAAFRGVRVCQGVRKSSLPGKARGFRGGRTPSNAMAASMSSWRRSTNGSRKTRPPTAGK